MFGVSLELDLGLLRPEATASPAPSGGKDGVGGTSSVVSAKVAVLSWAEAKSGVGVSALPVAPAPSSWATGAVGVRESARLGLGRWMTTPVSVPLSRGVAQSGTLSTVPTPPAGCGLLFFLITGRGVLVANARMAALHVLVSDMLTLILKFRV